MGADGARPTRPERWARITAPEAGAPGPRRLCRWRRASLSLPCLGSRLRRRGKRFVGPGWAPQLASHPSIAAGKAASPLSTPPHLSFSRAARQHHRKQRPLAQTANRKPPRRQLPQLFPRSNTVLQTMARGSRDVSEISNQLQGETSNKYPGTIPKAIEELKASRER